MQWESCLVVTSGPPPLPCTREEPLTLSLSPEHRGEGTRCGAPALFSIFYSLRSIPLTGAARGANAHRHLRLDLRPLAGDLLSEGPPAQARAGLCGAAGQLHRD